MDLELTVTFAGIVLAGVAGVLGVWMERDREAPQKWAWVFSSLIVVAVGIEMVHSVSAEAEDAVTEERMATVLEQLTQISERSDNPALKSFVGSELAAQARNNPEVMEKVGEKLGDPDRLLRQAAVGRRTAAGLPARRPAGASRPGSKNRDAGKSGSKSKSKGQGKSQGKSAGKKGGKSKNGDAASKSKSGGKKGGKGKSSNASKSKSGDKKGANSSKKGGSSKGKSSSQKSGKSKGGKKKGGKKKR